MNTIMDRDDQIKHAKRLQKKAEDKNAISGVFAEIAQFLKTYAGPKNEFLASVKEYNPRHYNNEGSSRNITAIIQSYIDYLEAGLYEAITPERRAQLDTVLDFFEQAQILLESKNIHPAAPIVLIGASLEEFLRTWVENEGISLGNKKPSLDSYATILKEAEFIGKQDIKDITSWAGLRNHAAHGEWEQVNDKARANLMLKGVNLFMRKYGM